jgi:hypothetical protein
MGKKPVLGLVGLCLGLTLTGCKDCNCGGTSRKEVETPVARVKRTTSPTTAQADGRRLPAGTETNSVWNKGGASAMKPAHDYDPNQYSPPTKRTGMSEQADTMAGTPVSTPDHGVLREPAEGSEPTHTFPKEAVGGHPAKDAAIEGSGQPTVIPPQPPMTSGKIRTTDGLATETKLPALPETPAMPPMNRKPDLGTPPAVIDHGSGPAPVLVTPPSNVEEVPVPGSPPVPTPEVPTPARGVPSAPGIKPDLAPAPTLDPPAPPGAMSDLPLPPPGK